MNQLTKIFATTLISAAVLTACGGGGGSKSTAPVSEFAISGTAVKGIIKNGIVKIYGVTNGVKDTTALIEGTTDANGDYNLTVEGYDGPVIIEITAGANSKMKCDVLAGCEGVAFGADLDLTSNFTLKAVVPSVTSGQSVTTNVSALTSLAAELAENSGNISATNINNANSQVASLFNISGKLTELATVDITDANDVAAADGEAQEAAILNAALLSAALKDAANGTSVADVLASIAQDFVNNSGQITNIEATDGAKVSLSEIYEEALGIISSDTLKDVNLGTLESTTELLKAKSDNATPDSLSEAEPSEPGNEDSTQAAKDMVNAVRAFGLASTYNNGTEAALVDSLDVAADLVDTADLDVVTAYLDFAATAINAAYLANMAAIEADEDPLTEFIYYTDSQAAFPVSIVSGTNGDTYSIDKAFTTNETQSVAVDVDVSAVIALAADETITPISDSEENGTFTGSLAFALTGFVSTTNVSMTINSGTVTAELNSDWTESWSDNPYSETWNEMLELASFDFDLDVTIAQLTGDAPISFTGKLALAISDLTADINNESGSCDIANGPAGTSDCFGESYNDTEEFTFDELDILLSGEFIKGAESVKATVTFNVDPDPTAQSLKSTYSGNWIQYFVDGYQPADAYGYSSSSELLGETTENYIGVSFGISLDFDASANSTVTGLTFVANRTGLEAAKASLDIKVGNKSLDIDFDVTGDDVAVVVTDQNGDTLSFTDTCVEDECSTTGSILVDGVEVATISTDADTGVTVVTYSDGSFEVL